MPSEVPRLQASILLSFLLLGCLAAEKPTPTPQPSDSPTPTSNSNQPPKVDLNYSWTGGDKDRPWTCSKNTFTAEVSDPDGDKINSIMWYDDGNPVWKCSNKTSCETKLWPDGTHTIKLTATDDKGANTFVEKQINVKYEVPEPVPVKTKDEVDLAIVYCPMGVEPKTHDFYDWSMTINTPLLGLHDLTDPVAVDWHIKWALEHGINNFWIMAALHGNPPEVVGNESYMTYYRDGFLKAKYKDKIKFNVFLDTQLYNPFSKLYIPTDSIEKDIEVLSKYYFNQPNYNKINGKPVLYLGFIDDFLPYWDDNADKNERKEFLGSFIRIIRDTAKRNSYDLFLIGDLRTPYDNNKPDLDEFLIKQFDAITSYNLDTARDIKKYKWQVDEKGKSILIIPYEHMVEAAIKREKELSELVKRYGKAYIPVVHRGFNNEKAFAKTDYYNWMSKRTNPIPEKFEELIEGVKPLIDPKVDILLLSTYNEFQEETEIEPTHEFGFAYLDIIRDNFAIKPKEGWPPNLVPLKTCGCTEYKHWNEEIGMPGNFKVEENGFLELFSDERKIFRLNNAQNRHIFFLYVVKL